MMPRLPDCRSGSLLVFSGNRLHAAGSEGSRFLTRPLYHEDPRLARFESVVVATRPAEGGTWVALDATARLSGVRALHSVPVVGDGPAEMIARMCIPAERGWVLEAELYASPLSGRFLLLPDEPGLTTFLRGLKMA